MATVRFARAPGYVLPLLQATAGRVSTVKEFILQDGQGGVYTTARCTADNRVFELESHLDRIVGGLQELFPAEYSNFASSIGKQNTQANDLLAKHIRTQMRDVAEEFSDASRITIVGHSPSPIDVETAEASSTTIEESISRHFPISVLGEPLPLPPAARGKVNGRMGGVPVVVRLCARDNPAIKDSTFVAEREQFEKTKGVCNEVLLASFTDGPGGETISILEGGSSNFFSLYHDEQPDGDGTRRLILRTAGEGQVLSGTVRKLVLQVAQELNSSSQGEYQVVVDDRNAPLLDEIDQWAGCFVTSTSRLVLPIDRVVVPAGILVSPPSDGEAHRTH